MNKDVCIRSNELWLGIFFMGSAAILFPVKDGLVKALSGSIGAIEAAAFYFLVQAVVALIWLILGERKFDLYVHLTSFSWLLLSRSACQVIAIVLFFYAIQFAPLAEAVVLFASNAIFIVIFSAFLLQEKISPKIFATVLLGFTGVFIVLAPNIQAFENTHLVYALLSAIFFALYIVATRRLGSFYTPVKMLFVDGIFGSILTICISVTLYFAASGAYPVPDFSSRVLLFLIGSGLIGTCSALLVIYAIKRAPVSVIAPLGYLEIVSAAIIGVTVFDEKVVPTTIVGCVIIMLSSWLVGKRRDKNPEPV